MGLTPCPTCQRHIRDDAKCPFCAAPRVGIVAATLIAAGCGGPAKPVETKPTGNPPVEIDAGVPATTPTPDATVIERDPDDGHNVRPLYGVDRR